MTLGVRRQTDAYHDSLRLLDATRAIETAVGVSWGAALMGTPQNVELLSEQGIDATGARANDLVLAVRADSEDHAEHALDAAEAALSGTRPAELETTQRPRRTTADAAASLVGANVAVVSVPGPYAALEAHHALSAGLHVLLFSDGVSVDDELALKERGDRLGLLVMGPGAGTAVFGGAGLGFANAVQAGPVGVVAAAGTGAQEVLALLAAADTGVAAVIGVGGRDLSHPVGGLMTRAALRMFAERRDVEVVVLVSKPPDPDVLAAVIPAAGGKPLVAVALGVDAPSVPGVQTARTIDAGVTLALAELGISPPTFSGLGPVAETAIGTVDPSRTAVRGVFSGGTLCYQAMLVLSRRLGPVYSNTPLQADWRMPAPPGGHVCIDAGAEEFTLARPHPMIDPQARADLLKEAGSDPTTAVLLFDVLLGHGAHPDPAGVLAPIVSGVRGPAVAVNVVGTSADPQGLEDQRRTLAEAGCLVAPTGAQAALLAAAIAGRDATLVEDEP
jgi:FdrA protein